MNDVIVDGLIEGAVKTANGLIGFFVGGDAMGMIEDLVKIYDDKDMANDDKRKAVKAEVMPFVRAMGKELVSVAIALFVTLLRMQITSLQAGKSDGSKV